MADPDRLAEIDELFEAVLDAPPEEAERLLAAREADDPALVREVRALLAYDRGGGSFAVTFDTGRLARLDAAAGHTDEDDGGALAGTRIGAYRLVQRIGRGGMGDVWLGERADGGFEQRVALKLLPSGYLSPNARRRFEAERQILASLSHDNIARLLDGGVDDAGRPFLAMELVEGRPITEHCDGERLDLAERLRLVVVAARAVQAAHRRLVVHCDLKPANILVTAEGAVKLLDFGIAELVDPERGAPAGETGLRRLTPGYASPESLAGERITTAADVYQLGLLVYELTCGRRARRHAGASLAELRREVLGTAPPPPSAALEDAGLDPPASEIAARRGTTVRRLRRALAGDLDAIAGRAIARDPEERYASAESLARDLERWLDRRPVHARPTGWVDRTARLARRHPAISGLAAGLAVLAAGLVHQAGVARQERDRAEQEARVARSLAARTQEVSGFLVTMLTDATLEDLRGDLTVGQLLDQGVVRTRTELAPDSAARADLEEILGRVYARLDRAEESLALLTEAVARKRAIGAPPAELAESLLFLASAHNDLGQHGATKRLLGEALELQRRGGAGAGTMELAATLSLLSYAHGMLGELEPMLALREESLAIRRSLFGPRHLETAQGLNDLCFAYNDIGEYRRAEELCREALAIRIESGDERLVASSRNNLARVEASLGRLAEAEASNGAALAWALANLPREQAWTGRLFATRGLVLTSAGRLDEAAADLAAAREIFTSIHPPQHRDFAWLDILDAQVETARGEAQAAEARVRDALASLRRDHGEDQHLVLQGRIVLAEALLAQGREAEALGELEDAERRLAVGRSATETWLRRANGHLERLAPRAAVPPAAP